MLAGQRSLPTTPVMPTLSQRAAAQVEAAQRLFRVLAPLSLLWSLVEAVQGGKAVAAATVSNQTQLATVPQVAAVAAAVAAATERNPVITPLCRAALAVQVWLTLIRARLSPTQVEAAAVAAFSAPDREPVREVQAEAEAALLLLLAAATEQPTEALVAVELLQQVPTTAQAAQASSSFAT